MNELVFQNATSIPSKQVTIPIERIFGQNKPGFGRSEHRMNQMEPKEVLRLLTDKFSNLSLSRTQRSQSFYSGDSDASTEASVAKFVVKKKPVQTRMHIPSHKNHYAQIQLEIEKEREAKIKSNISGIEQENEQQQNVLHQDKGRLQKLKLERMVKKQAKEAKEQEKPVIERINEANNEFLKSLYEINEDLITPQQQKFKTSVKYKQTYKASFRTTERENMKDLTIKNKFAPGPGDYEVKRMFDDKKKKKLRSISMQHQVINEQDEEQQQYTEEDNGRKMSEINKIKNKLNKALNLEQEIENETMKNELLNQNYFSVGQQPQNISYMFVKDDRDRFGDQIFPLSSVIPVPGPGKYEQNHFSMEKKLMSIQSQEEQKRLLKIWLHPSGKEEAKAFKASLSLRNQSLDPAGPIHLKHY